MTSARGSSAEPESSAHTADYWERTRAFFPVTRRFTYLNHAGVAPISSRVAEAITRFLNEAAESGAADYPGSYEREIERVRGRCATLLHTRPEQIAFVKNTTEGLGLVANGLDWRRGDRVVTCDLEFPSNVYPWWSLRERGVETRMLPTRGGRLDPDHLENALRDPAVRLLALSAVEFASGARNDLETIGSLCRERGVLFCVDAIQSLGCQDLDVSRTGIDFLAADGHKWMLSVEGCGIFYCAAHLLDRIQPRLVGWHNVTADYDGYDMSLRRDAVRFEEGTPNTPGIFGLGAAVDLLLEIGVPAIEERVQALTTRLAEGLVQRGAIVHSPRGPGEGSGIISFALPEEPAEETARRLVEARFVVKARRGNVRVSPHFYNDDAEIDALLEALSS